MPDRIAIFCRGGQYTLAILTNGRWWRVTDERLKTTAWPNEQQARAYLGRAADRYRHDYGESLGWDVENVPVITLQ